MINRSLAKNIFKKSFIIISTKFSPVFSTVLLLAALNQSYLIAQSDSESNELTVMTYNIRFAGVNPQSDTNDWEHRKNFVTDLFIKNSPDIIGLQEALLSQINYIDSVLIIYNWEGIGRDDGFKKGEFSPIFYKKDKFQLITKGTFWLSWTPYKPSKGWDAAFNRVATWIQLKDKESGKYFYVYNTHFDHVGDSARYESAKLIMNKIVEETSGDPVILMGDFNFTKESKGYKEITSSSNKKMFDAQFVSATPHTGGNITFNGFGTIEGPGEKIDFIFVTENISVNSHSIIAKKYEGRFPSDHYPVLSKIKFN
ncbi:MAG: endonuclease/exonuclease/phosphatase family protein [Ignavibacteriales bacterium]|nr:MAG: endonuclease/exonuclease/phosphatase family protein [Ignavibacteriales bacterium]